jgi:hypothetical protein
MIALFSKSLVLTTTCLLIEGILLEAFLLNCLSFFLLKGILTEKASKTTFVEANIKNAFNYM